MDIVKFSEFLKRYFVGLRKPEISQSEASVLVDEISEIASILKEYPEISYNDLWDRIHGIYDDVVAPSYL